MTRDRVTPWAVFALFAGVLLVSLIVSARAKPFWHDEIFTILHAELSSLSAMWAAGIDGIDLSPPLNTWLTRAVHEFGGVGRVSSRVPPMAGFLLMSAVVFHLLKTRANTATALSGTLLPCFTAAYRYSYEARGYGLMVGLFALSLYAWSEAANSRRRAVHVPLLTIALAASVWNHYYGILTFLPIAGGEVVRAIQRRRLDAGIAAAFLASLVAMLPLYPLAAAAREQSRSFWSPASLSDVGSTYHFLFAPLIQQPAFAIITLIAIALFFRRPKAARTARTVAAHELVAGALSLLIPVLGVGMGVAVTGVFVPRYAMSAVVGVSLVIPLAVWQRQTRWGIGELFLCGLLAITFAMAIRPFLASPPVFQDPFLRRPLLQSAVTSGPPVVSSSSLQFLQYWYYSPSNLKGRLRYLADPEEARKRMRSDTIDRGYLALRRWTAVPVDPYVEYVAGHREFRVHEAGSGWLLGKLDEAGAAREEIGRSPGERLFAVRLP